MKIITSLTLLLLAALPTAAADMEWVKVLDDNKGIVLAELGKPFISWGFNYDHEGDGKLIEDYWDDQWPTVESAFREMKGLGANVVRIHLQFGTFMESPTKPRQSSLDQLARLVKLAEETGLYLDVTGLGCYHKPEVTTIPEAITLSWLELVREKTPQILGQAGSQPQYDNVTCEGTYQHHLQGICVDGGAIYWSFTTTLVKTDLSGKLLKKVPVANHHGDLCFHHGKLYVAVNLGKFNDPKGNADSWVYVYDADTLKELARHEVQEMFHGAGGIGFRDGHFFVVGGLPDGVEENYVYEYDGQFRFLKKHVIKSGHTHLGIQTATFTHDRWWFGCYADPKILLVTDAEFQMKGRYEFDCSLGIEGLPDGRLLSASGRCEEDKGCTGSVQVAVPDEKTGLRYRAAGGDDQK